MSTIERKMTELGAGTTVSTAELIALIGDPSKPDSSRDGKRIETAPALDIKTELA